MIFIQPSINPIIVSLGFIDIRWYSLAYVLAFILGSVLIKKLNNGSYKLISDVQIDKFFVSTAKLESSILLKVTF